MRPVPDPTQNPEGSADKPRWHFPWGGITGQGVARGTTKRRARIGRSCTEAGAGPEARVPHTAAPGDAALERRWPSQREGERTLLTQRHRRKQKEAAGTRESLSRGQTSPWTRCLPESWRAQVLFVRSVSCASQKSSCSPFRRHTAARLCARSWDQGPFSPRKHPLQALIQGEVRLVKQNPLTEYSRRKPV